MLMKIIGTIIGAMLLGAGVYYLVKEKGDAESEKIYGTVSAVGGVLFVVMLILTVTDIS